MAISRTTYYLNAFDPKYKRVIEHFIGNPEAISDAERPRIRARIHGYLKALEDTGTISNQMFKTLYAYYTLQI